MRFRLAQALCAPLPDDRMHAAPANPAVNGTARDRIEGPELLVAPATLPGL